MGFLASALDHVFWWQKNHCQQCYDWERARKDLPSEYQDTQLSSD